jgi:hypothetical protein
LQVVDFGGPGRDRTDDLFHAIGLNVAGQPSTDPIVGAVTSRLRSRLERYRAPGHTTARPAQFDVVLTTAAEIGGEVGTSIVISPDGTRVVFLASGPDGVPHLHLRRHNQPQESELPGTDGARGLFLSPGDAWVGFWSGGKVQN